jgi:hypothetical protein
MEVMYLKYIHGIRHSIIKEGGNIIMNDSKIIPFKLAKKAPVNKSTPSFNSKESSITPICNDKINEEITNFFFDAIHRNYLSSRKK